MNANTYRKQKEIPISSKQVTVIKMAQRQLDIPDEDYRDMLEIRFRVRSCTKLTYGQAGIFIAELEKKGFTLRPPKPGARRAARKPLPRRKSIVRGKGNVAVMVMPSELDKIDAVAALIEWRYEDGLQRFLATRMGLKDGKVRTSFDAELAIEGLKKLFENHMKKVHGPSWWTMHFDDSRIREYIRIHCPVDYRPFLRGIRVV